LVVDHQEQEIGLVKRIIDFPSNTLLQVKYKNELIEIPLNEDMLYYLDNENKIIKLHLPDGLLNLE